MKHYIYTILFLLVSSTVLAQTPASIVKEGNYTIDSSSGSITLEATGSITLKPNTWIKSGSVFLARIIEAEEITSALDAYTPVAFSDENYVFTRSFQTAMTTFNPSTAKEGDVIESIAYFDGLGRPMQQVGIKSAPDKKDIITHVGYDDFGRQDKDWLPYHETAGNNGAYRGDVRTNTQQHYSTHYGTDFAGVALADINAYSQKGFEASPLNRVLKQAAPGKDWKLEAGNEIEFDYQSNGLDEVRLFNVNTNLVDGVYTTALVDNSVYYDEGTLYKTITKDENHTSGTNHTTEEFKNKQGQVILKRTYANISGVSTPHDTHYVYDDYGNLSYVLPPKVNLTDGISPTELSELCYQYQYDYRNRLAEKKIPGKAKEYIIYDNLDRPVLTQDANLEEDNQWLFTKYDSFGRVIYTGLFTSAESLVNLRNNFKNKTEATDNYETKVTTGTGYSNSYYTNNDYPNTNIELLTVNYYDNYYFDKDGLSLPEYADAEPVINYDNNTQSLTKSLATGSKVAVLETNPTQWITTITGYDKKARPIYVASNNSYLETVDVVTSTLDFAGKVTKTYTAHNKTGKQEIITIDKLAYDHEGRLLKQKHTINDKDQETIAENTYDNLGQLISKGVGGLAINTNRLQTIDYAYNVRGWLKQINNPNSLGDDLFGFKIGYNEGSNLLFNGNISLTEWKTANTDDNSLKNYNYQYDALNRITSAIDNTAKYNLTSVTYDKNGNIKDLVREGHIVENPVLGNNTHFGTMDDLNYDYGTLNGNKLYKVRDDENNAYGFKDSTTDDQDYWYDANGNMTKDDNKGITNISYNHLNLPTSVTINNSEHNGTISYFYDATGVKLKKEVSTGATTAYAGNYVYEDGSLKFFNHPEGYVDAENGFDYVYQYKDHLGNVRLSYKDSDNNGSVDSSEILEENNYYPFGLKHKGYNNVVNGTDHKYGFAGKEEQDELGLNWIDVTARNYDPALGRWMNIDPLAEGMRRHSPYNYAFNNPVYFIDYDGMAPEGSNCDDCKTKYQQSTQTTYTFMGETPEGGVHNLSHTVTQTVSTYNDDFTEVTETTTTTTHNVQFVTGVDEEGNNTFVVDSSTKRVRTESQSFENTRESTIFVQPDGSNTRDTKGAALTERTSTPMGKNTSSSENVALDQQHTAIRGYAINLRKDLQANRKFNPFKGDATTNMIMTGASGGAALAVGASNADKRLKVAFSAGVLIGNLGRNLLSHEGRSKNLGSSKKIFWKK